MAAVLSDARAPESSVLIAHGADRRPNETASDWVTNADHVVVATVQDEDPRDPSATDLARGEGITLRDLTLSVDEVVWSADKPARPAPDTFTWVAYGWQFKGDSDSERIAMTGDDEPRLERGHTYIMSLQWQPARCGDGDTFPGQWRGLGSSALLPYDDDTIGQGEFEGRTQVTPEDNANRRGRVADDLAGEDAAALREALREATPNAAATKGSDGAAAASQCAAVEDR